MRTMYIVCATFNVPTSSYLSEQTEMGKYNTFEEALWYAEHYIQRDNWCEGSWKIWAKTIDEATFTVEEKVVKVYDYVEEHRGEYYKEAIATCLACMLELEKNKARCKTENGIAKKDKEIARYREEMKELHKRLAKWQEKHSAHMPEEQKKG